MADGEVSAPLLLPRAAAAETTTTAKEKHYHKGCPGCRLDEANEGKTGVPLLNFFYIWLVCLVACEFFIRSAPLRPPILILSRNGMRSGSLKKRRVDILIKLISH
jgi:hypothetical protein